MIACCCNNPACAQFGCMAMKSQFQNNPNCQIYKNHANIGDLEVLRQEMLKTNEKYLNALGSLEKRIYTEITAMRNDFDRLVESIGG